MGFFREPKNTANEQMAPPDSMSTSLTLTDSLTAIYLEGKKKKKTLEFN